MARLTKLRAHQTRASKVYDAAGENLATDKEVENRVRKHSAMFHHFRDDNTNFFFDADDNLSQIPIQDPMDADNCQKVDFSFDSNGNLSQILKEIWDSIGDKYIKMQKDFLFDTDGNLDTIQNRII